LLLPTDSARRALPRDSRPSRTTHAAHYPVILICMRATLATAHARHARHESFAVALSIYFSPFMVSAYDRSSLDDPFSSTPSSAAMESSSDDDGAVHLPSAPAAVVQQVNIRSHVPITLSLKESNYGQWRCCFDSVLGKFGLLATAPRRARRRVDPQ